MTKEWATENLGKLCEIKTGRKDVNQGNPQGKYPFYTCAKDHTYSDEYSFEGEAILIAGNGDVGNTSYYNGKFEAYQRTYVLMDFDRVLPQYLYRILDGTLKATLYDQKLGNTMPYIKMGMLAEFPIPLPPLSEQRRIVAILDDAFAAIATATANAEKNLTNAREISEGIFDLAATGGLFSSSESNDESAEQLIERAAMAKRKADTDGTSPRTTRPKTIDETDPPFEIPQSWRWTRLDQLSVGITDGVHKTPDYVPAGVPFVTVRNLTAGPGISFDNLKYITHSDHEEFIKRTHPERGDILITKDGTIGVVRLIETDIVFSIFVSVSLVKPSLPELSQFLAIALSSAAVQVQIVPKGAALKHMYLADLRQMWIPVPPLIEQEQVVSSCSAVRARTAELESLYTRKLALLAELKQSILQKAFTGELTTELAELEVVA